MTAWNKLSERLPEPKQTVLVVSEAWSTPRVLVYEEFPFQRLVDRLIGRHYWYPERMHWAPVTPWPNVSAQPATTAPITRASSVPVIAVGENGQPGEQP